MYLRQRALLHLETLYMTSLEALDTRLTTSTITGVCDHLLVARTAMQVDAPWIAPCVIYSACCLGADYICATDSPETPLDSVQRFCLTGREKQIQAYSIRPHFYVHIMQPAAVTNCLKQGHCVALAATVTEVWQAIESRFLTPFARGNSIWERVTRGVPTAGMSYMREPQLRERSGGTACPGYMVYNRGM
ncbi:hypothetical protein FB451DRAFT_1417190 [Mycena latifolia]|nr:hypothetical protein FB451DRAFT_1417190 [Mycena latifolia]